MTIKSCTPLLNVADCERSLAFYRDVLGFEVASTWDEGGQIAWAELRSGPVRLMLNGRGGDPAHRFARPAYRDAVICLGVDSVHALCAELRRHGFEPPEPEAQEYGLDEIVIRDPDGYDLSLSSPTDLSRRS
jgi:uncharacterized glyoxalase superfamily protein PhnB